MASARVGSWIPCFVLGALLAQPARTAAAVNLELYGTFESMGVIVTLTAGEDPGQLAVADVYYQVAGSGSERRGLPLSRVAAGRFVGSLFGLTPGTAYAVRVAFSAPLAAASRSGTASTRDEVALPAPSRSYHVSPTGTGSCAEASPCALTTAIGQAQAGEEVVLHGGTYYQGGLTLPRSGSDGAPIVLRGATGEVAVLDGADPATFGWAKEDEKVYRATVNVGGTHLVMADGRRLYPYSSYGDLRSLAQGVPGFFAEGTTVHVRLVRDGDSASPDPTQHALIVSRFATAFTVQARDHIVFANLVFRHYGGGEYSEALYFNGASDNLVQGCTFAVNDRGVAFKNDAHRNVVQDSVFYDTDFSWPWAAVKAGSGLETGGIRMYGPMTGRGTVIRRNTFHDFFDGFGACPDETAGATNETDVHENLIFNVGDDGMETDGQCSNVRIWRNTFHDVLVGISLAPAGVGPVYALRNLVYRTGAGDNDWSGTAFKFNSGDGASGPMYLFHNTVDAVTSGTSGLGIQEGDPWKLIYARNNVWAGTDYAITNNNPGQPFDADYDDLYAAQAGELVYWDGLADRHLDTLVELRTATGQEAHGLAVSPGFTDASSGRYTLGPGSQLIDQGMLIPGVNDGYEGHGPDIGAFESSLSAAVHGACGSASGGSFASAPTADLCAAGTPSPLAGAGPWAWSCRGAGGGADAQCGAAFVGDDTAPSGGGSGGGPASSSGKRGGCATGSGGLSGLALLPLALRRRRR